MRSKNRARSSTRWTRGVVPMLAGLVLSASAGCSSYEVFFPPLPTAQNVEVPRYLGKWYEIARYPNGFQQQCVGGTTAEYNLNDDGSIQVLNRCRTGSLDGPEDTILGRATVSDSTTNAKLSVSFFGPFGAPYWILEVGSNYEYAVVGEPSRSFLWILSRTPAMDETVYNDILSRLSALGYDPSRLVKTPQ